MGLGTAKRFDWGLHPDTEAFLTKKIAEFLANNKYAGDLAVKMEEETSTRFFDWVDHILLPGNEVNEKTLLNLGFEEKNDVKVEADMQVFFHPDTVFFPVLLTDGRFNEVALKPERLDHFVQMSGMSLAIEGATYSPYRRAILYQDGVYVLSAVERRGYNGFIVPEKAKYAQEYRQALETFFFRERHYASDEEGVQATKKILERVSKTLPLEMATDAFFRAERLYWERRNWPAQVQKARQDSLGLGWGNHDHHTYRSSRKNFADLVEIFESMGFGCREQFYAGERAGWGAQIMEHPVCDFVVFADVDLTKAEREEDFAHKKMQDLPSLATVGLWVGLHGESVLKAGMHHLASRYDFERLKEDLKKYNVGTMPPFSYFEFLKQAFTEPGRWPVDKERLSSLLDRDSITKAQHDDFQAKGGIAGHLENIQRGQGFKGFNQESVSAILKVTDPRKYLEKGA